MYQKEEKFCREYVKCGNAYKAMIAAGYSEKEARNESADILADFNINRRVEELQDNLSEAAEVTTLMIALEVKKIAFASIGDLGGVMTLKDYEALPADAKAGIASFRCQRKEKNGEVTETVHIRMQNKLSALRMLAKMLGFTKPAVQTKEPEPEPKADPMPIFVVEPPEDFEEQDKRAPAPVAAQDQQTAPQQQPPAENPAPAPAAQPQTPAPPQPPARPAPSGQPYDPRNYPYYTPRRGDMF